MYFNEKEDTNIDKEFKNSNKLDPEKNRKMLIIGGIILLLIIAIVLIFLFLKNRKTYYIELNGGNSINVYEGMEFVDPGYIAYDNHHNSLTNSVVVNGNVNEKVIGSYTITYSLKNKSVSRVVNVIASQAQYTRIYLKGDKIMKLKVGEAYNEPGYYYNDIKVGDMHDQIKVNGTVDSSKAGQYRITYSVVNSEEVTITAERVVIVE